MNDHQPGPGELMLAAEPLDTADEAVLRELREVARRLDPCPAALTERVKFALAVKALHAEVAELTAQPELVSRAFGDEPAQATTVTFSTDSLSVMVSVVPTTSGRARVDGWLTCGHADVRLDTDDGHVVEVQSDADGRFVLEDVPRGGARLLVRNEGMQPVITPTFAV